MILFKYLPRKAPHIELSNIYSCYNKERIRHILNFFDDIELISIINKRNNEPTRKIKLDDLLKKCHGNTNDLTEEECLWLNTPPVGKELI
jgi:hypothetical protein